MFTRPYFRHILREAVRENDLEGVVVILDRAREAYPMGLADTIDDDGESEEETSVLHVAALSNKCTPLILKTLLHPSNLMFVGLLEDHDESGRTPLQTAAYELNISAMRAFIDRGADVNAVGWRGMTALHHACGLNAVCHDQESVDAVTLLLDNHADIDAVNIVGETALCISLEMNLPLTVRLLVERGADISIDPHSMSIIHQAIRGQTHFCEDATDTCMQIDMLDLLISRGADMHKLDAENRSVLDRAVVHGNRYACRFINLILQEIPTQAEKWSEGNITRRCEAVAMSQIARLGACSGMHTIPREMLDIVLDQMKKGAPVTLASAALYALKERHRYLPIRDIDTLQHSTASALDSLIAPGSQVAASTHALHHYWGVMHQLIANYFWGA